jgi:hypothetical protein
LEPLSPLQFSGDIQFICKLQLLYSYPHIRSQKLSCAAFTSLGQVSASCGKHSFIFLAVRSPDRNACRGLSSRGPPGVDGSSSMVNAIEISDSAGEGGKISKSYHTHVLILYQGLHGRSPYPEIVLGILKGTPHVNPVRIRETYHAFSLVNRSWNMAADSLCHIHLSPILELIEAEAIESATSTFCANEGWIGSFVRNLETQPAVQCFEASYYIPSTRTTKKRPDLLIPFLA